MIVGVDEVGRGALAGPLCVGAASLGDVSLEGLTDSKLLTSKRCAVLDGHIRRKAHRAALGWVSAGDVDRLGISESMSLACWRALSQLNLSSEDQIILDGTSNFLSGSPLAEQVTTMKKADLSVPSVSAAAVLAKSARDKYMRSVAPLFPGYEFCSHVGYGTKKHLSAIEQLGPSLLHRLSFAPFNHYANQVPAEYTAEPTSGQLAEDAACQFLRSKRFSIVERNWKTRWCEIDIVAKSGNKIWLVEVKYRSSDRQGSGLDYITPRKLEQMRLSARFWQYFNKHQGELGLAAIEVAGSGQQISQFVTDL